MSLSSISGWLRGAAVALAIAAIVLGVFAAGGARVRIYTSLELLAAAAGMLWVVSWLREDLPNPALAWLPGCLLLVGLVQLVPLPQFVLRIASPIAFSAQRDCEQLNLLPGWCFSLYPGATWAAMIQWVIFTIVAAMIAHAGKKSAARRAVAIALVAIGLVELPAGLLFRGDPSPLDAVLAPALPVCGRAK